MTSDAVLKIIEQAVAERGLKAAIDLSWEILGSCSKPVEMSNNK